MTITATTAVPRSVRTMAVFMLTSAFVPRFTRSTLLIALATTTSLVVGPNAADATFPPSYHFKSLYGAKVTVHFHEGLEPMARQAVALADQILAGYEQRYDYRIGRVQIVLADSEDDPNGFTTPLPYPEVQLRAAAPDGSDEFGNLEDWLQILLTHELAHSIHLEQGRGLVKVGRAIFGRAPFLFPNGNAPTWLVEGLATYEETENTAFGRGRNPDSLMVRRMAAWAGAYPREDQATAGFDRWPMGQTAYLFGEGFLRDLTTQFGVDTLPRVATTTARWPVPFIDELVARHVTGATFHSTWSTFAAKEREQAASFAAERGTRGLTSSCALTTRGVRQTNARFSPDGTRIAFTSSSLTRPREIHVLSLSDGREQVVTDRHGGIALSWTPDGKEIVYEEEAPYQLYQNRYDLRAVDVETGHARRLTRGLRATDPDVAPDGSRIVFVRRYADRSELALVSRDGNDVRDLTASPAGTQWSGPRFDPAGTRVAAARWTEGGFLDLALVEVESGAIQELMHDRARDVEPTWTPDGRHIVFRSDRDGVSNLYAWRVEDGVLLRVTNVLGGAFTPEVSPDGHTVAFSDYSANGYDVHLMDADWAALPAAPPFVDPYPAGHALPAPVDVETRAYHALPSVLPHYWSPYVTSTGSAGEIRVGATTSGSDPLGRHIWGIDVYRGDTTRRFGGSGFYLYDRFRPQLLLLAEDNVAGQRSDAQRQQQIMVNVDVPLARGARFSHDVSIAWRRSHQELPDNASRDFGGVELRWFLGHDVQGAPLAISPSQGETLSLAAIKEDPALGSAVSLAKAEADARVYRRVFGNTDILALRAGAGTTFGRPTFTRSYTVGGFPGSSLLDIVRTNDTVLRGYPDDVFVGRSFVHGNVEYRFPLAFPERGLWSFPVFVRHLHATVFADAANAFTGELRLRDLKTSAGAALGADLFLGHAVPITATVGVARGFAEGGETRRYLRLGLAF